MGLYEFEESGGFPDLGTIIEERCWRNVFTLSNSLMAQVPSIFPKVKVSKEIFKIVKQSVHN